MLGWRNEKNKPADVDLSVVVMQKTEININDEIAQKTELYLRLAAAGTTRTDLQRELFCALGEGHFELAQAITKLGRQDFSGFLVDWHDKISLSCLRLKRDIYNASFRSGREVYPLVYFVIKKNYKALDFLIAHKYELDGRALFYKEKTPIFCALHDPQMLEYLLKYGAKATDEEVAKAIIDKAPLKCIELLLSYGGSQDFAKLGLTTLVSHKDFPADYAAQVAQLLKLLVAEKSVLPAPMPPELTLKIIEAPSAVPLSPDEVVIESPFKGNRTLSKVFNFNSFECIYTIGKGPTAPIETMQVKQFSELQHSPDLRTAFEEHKKRGGTRTEEEILGMSAPRKTLKWVNNIAPEQNAGQTQGP